MLNREVRQLLFSRIRVSRQALNQRAQRIKDKYGPMTTDEAVYIIAHLEGIDLSKYLPLSQLDRIRSLIPREIIPTKIGTQKKSKTKKKKAKTNTYPLISDAEVQKGIIAGEEVYPVMFVVENSIRKYIVLVLSKVSPDWWDNIVSKPIREKVQSKIDKEKKYTHREQRGNEPIMYCDFIDLRNIISSNYKYFKDVIVNIEWFRTMMDEVYMARNNLAHNVPLSDDDISQIAIFSREWARVLDTDGIK